ncbi:discoidin domain-containing protein [Mucilaginibacter boryungensis]|uniref:Discoidin domain-containing protein n=1 Tax=Mucilaginibacter boryungensis TaxID=768480 RepID=A0ABR9XH28_9SPHI|nr:discoidin domain-containing protein [Mucilaginibacter boryungensis]MBE9666571.1 discoidin domain-containing protein [Mucilaginibacter boryungensis]
MKKRNILSVICGLIACSSLAQNAKSQWVYKDKTGKLTYKTTATGDRIMDFSHAGYMGGGVALPVVQVRRTVKSSGGADDTKQIQNAVNEVAAMPLVNGFRGTVLLGPGVFTCSASITLSASGVVLRGSGTGPNGTIIKMTGSRHTAIVIGVDNTNIALGRTERADDNEEGKPTTITDAYVPAGTNSFTVVDASGFAVGDTLVIRRPVTEAWIHLMGMDDMKRDGKPQTWINKSAKEIIKRKIIAINGNKVTVNISLPDSYNAQYVPGTTVAKSAASRRVTQIGVEDLHIQCPPLETDYGHAPYAGIRVGGDDCWVKNVYCQETMNTTVLAGNRITMERVMIRHTFTNLGASKPADFSLEGSQNLIDRCDVTGGNTYTVWTSSLIAGPNVVLNCTFRGIGSRIQPHQRWATGLLIDNCTVADGGIDFMNRGVAGSGHGWTMGWAVAWNCIAKTYIIQNPPGAANWAIGCIGQRQQTARLFDSTPVLGEGYFDSHGKPVAIQSLYLAQLEERAGIKALRNIGYSGNTLAQFPNKKPRLTPVKTDVDKTLGLNLAFERPVNTSEVRGTTREFGGEKALDGNSKTYWATNDGQTTATLEVDMEGPVDINALKISEAPGSRIEGYKIEAQVQSDWTLLSEGGSIGDNRVVKFPKVTAWKVKLTITKSKDHPAISDFGLYLIK